MRDQFLYLRFCSSLQGACARPVRRQDKKCQKMPPRVYVSFDESTTTSARHCQMRVRDVSMASLTTAVRGRCQPAWYRLGRETTTTTMKRSGLLAFRVTAVSSRPVGRHPWTVRKSVLATSQACLPITNNKTLPQEIAEYCTCNTMSPAHPDAMRCYSRLQSANVILSGRRW